MVKRRIGLIGIALSSILLLTNCAYRLRAPLLPHRYDLRLIVSSPELYNVRVLSDEFAVAGDGRVSIRTPTLHPGCGVYLFDRIPLNRPADPLRQKIIQITSAGKTVKKLSMAELLRLPVDNSGQSILQVRAQR